MKNDFFHEPIPRGLAVRIKIPRCKKCKHLLLKPHDTCNFDHIPQVDEIELKRVIRSMSWRHGALSKMIAKKVLSDPIDAKIFKYYTPEIWERHQYPYGNCQACGRRLSLKDNLCYYCRKGQR
jgi:uncharacterized OB-fold protein